MEMGETQSQPVAQEAANRKKNNPMNTDLPNGVADRLGFDGTFADPSDFFKVILTNSKHVVPMRIIKLLSPETGVHDENHQQLAWQFIADAARNGWAGPDVYSKAKTLAKFMPFADIEDYDHDAEVTPNELQLRLLLNFVFKAGSFKQGNTNNFNEQRDAYEAVLNTVFPKQYALYNGIADSFPLLSFANIFNNRPEEASDKDWSVFQNWCIDSFADWTADYLKNPKSVLLLVIDEQCVNQICQMGEVIVSELVKFVMTDCGLGRTELDEEESKRLSKATDSMLSVLEVDRKDVEKVLFNADYSDLVITSGNNFLFVPGSVIDERNLYDKIPPCAYTRLDVSQRIAYLMQLGPPKDMIPTKSDKQAVFEIIKMLANGGKAVEKAFTDGVWRWLNRFTAEEAVTLARFVDSLPNLEFDRLASTIFSDKKKVFAFWGKIGDSLGMFERVPRLFVHLHMSDPAQDCIGLSFFAHGNGHGTRTVEERCEHFFADLKKYSPDFDVDEEDQADMIENVKREYAAFRRDILSLYKRRIEDCKVSKNNVSTLVTLWNGHLPIEVKVPKGTVRIADLYYIIDVLLEAHDSRMDEFLLPEDMSKLLSLHDLVDRHPVIEGSRDISPEQATFLKQEIANF